MDADRASKPVRSQAKSKERKVIRVQGSGANQTIMRDPFERFDQI
jgi:hypothetical protein